MQHFTVKISKDGNSLVKGLLSYILKHKSNAKYGGADLNVLQVIITSRHRGSATIAVQCQCRIPIELETRSLS